MPKIIPAILEQDIKEVENKINLVKNLATLVQIDITDGDFVDGTTVKLEELKNIDTPIGLEIHLMVNNPSEYFATCADIKAKRVFWHYSATDDIKATITAAAQYDFINGIALNPDTDINVLSGIIEKLEAVLVMGVIPGKQGQPFVPETIHKVEALKKMSPHVTIAVDGAVSADNIKQLYQAGASDFVVGSALFKNSDLQAEFNKLAKLLT